MKVVYSFDSSFPDTSPGFYFTEETVAMTHFEVELKPNSASEERRNLYIKAWNCGYKLATRRVDGDWNVTFVPYDGMRDRRIEPVRLQRFLQESPIVASTRVVN
jgi:hypothetical protein